MRERIAKMLGWTVTETQGFPLHALRELVRFTLPSDERDALVAEISETIRTGRYIVSR